MILNTDMESRTEVTASVCIDGKSVDLEGFVESVRHLVRASEALLPSQHRMYDSPEIARLRSALDPFTIEGIDP